MIGALLVAAIFYGLIAYLVGCLAVHRAKRILGRKDLG
jgi:hypothetical protein